MEKKTRSQDRGQRLGREKKSRDGHVGKGKGRDCGTSWQKPEQPGRPEAERRGRSLDVLAWGPPSLCTVRTAPLSHSDSVAQSDYLL